MVLAGPALAQRVPPAPVLTTAAYELDDSQIQARIAEIIADNDVA